MMKSPPLTPANLEELPPELRTQLTRHNRIMRDATRDVWDHIKEWREPFCCNSVLLAYWWEDGEIKKRSTINSRLDRLHEMGLIEKVSTRPRMFKVNHARAKDVFYVQHTQRTESN